MRASVAASGVLHGLALTAASFTVAARSPQQAPPKPPPPPVVSVDLVSVAKETNIRAASVAPSPSSKPDQAAEPARDAPPPTAKPTPKPTPAASNAPTPRAKPKPPTPQSPPAQTEVTAAAPREASNDDRQPDLDLDRLAARLDKLAKDTPDRPRLETETLESKTVAAAEEGADAPRPKAGLGTELTISETDAIRRAMRRCWRLPAGAPQPERLIVRVRVELKQDGALAGAPRILNLRTINASGDRFWRVAAENARRAIYQCAPYRLPPETYDTWRSLEFRFDPSDMLAPKPSGAEG